MYSSIAHNKRKTFFLFVGFLIFIAALSWLIGAIYGRPSFSIGALIGGGIYALISYFSAGRMALAINGAKPIAKSDNPRFYRIVENLSITEGLPMPKVYLINDPAPNAFATGRDPNHAVVCATTGLLDIMSDSELEGVMAHELGHIKNYDIRVSMAAFALVAAVSLLADILLRAHWLSSDDDSKAGQIFLIIGLVAALISPVVATMIQLAISRKREYLADASGALTTRYPEGLASALEKIAQHGSALKRANTSTAHLFIANPLRKGSLSSLFSTHPPVEERVRRLREIGRGE